METHESRVFPSAAAVAGRNTTDILQEVLERAAKGADRAERGARAGVRLLFREVRDETSARMLKRKGETDGGNGNARRRRAAG